MSLALDPIGPHIDSVARHWSTGVDHGATWPSQIVSAKHHAAEACWRIVDLAMEVSGGAGMFRGNDLERMFRDASCGCFHPANTFLTHEIVGSFAIMQPGTSHFAWTAEKTVAQVHSVGPWGITYVRRSAQEIARAQTLVAGDRQPPAACPMPVVRKWAPCRRQGPSPPR